MTDPQGEVLAFLGDPATWGGEPVHRIDTSCAAVFLVGARAYKMKRAVNLGYLDFSTVELRRRFCDAELSLNRRTAPELYLGIEEVTRRADGSLGLGGEGEAIEPLVVMERFPDNALGSRALAEGRVDRAMVEDLGRRLAAYHADCPVKQAPAAGMMPLLESCIAPSLAIAPIVPTARIEAVIAAIAQAFRETGPTVTARADAGWWRRVHGDLHLGNLCLLGDRLVPFDALEFNDTLASADVLYDLAFLIMDLRRNGRGDLALALFDAYGDCGPGGPSLIPGFIALRALIRAFVAHATWKLATGNPPPPLAAIDVYLSEAERSLADVTPRLVAVGGLSGTGKSTLARALAPLLGPAPGAVHLRTDVLRKQMFGVAETEPLPPEAYDPGVSGKVYGLLLDQAATVLATGRSVIVDGVFAREPERRAAADAATAAGRGFAGIWLDAPLALRQSRIDGRKGDASDATAEVAAAQEGYDLGRIAWHRLPAQAGVPALAALALRAVTGEAVSGDQDGRPL
ncbi:AAA family ATPase [Zavarzinia sp.]|uniref:bifunctional aminoglycoside phosphotransferase/ATP-binding protein n=1 Tax=Zavarzinia sp. TaxID=2027920 RepID=UPI00356A9492